jgi:adenylate cyclase
MAGLTDEVLAARAQTTPDRIRELEAAGVVAADAGGTYEPADAERIRLAEALIESGISLEDIRSATAAGRVSFAFVGEMIAEPVEYLPGVTMAEFTKSHGIPLELVQQVYDRFGLPRPQADSPVRTDEAEQMPLATMALSAGFNPEALARFSRVMGAHLRQLAAAQVHFFTEEVVGAMVASGMDPMVAWETGTQFGFQMRPLFGQLLMWVFERHQESFIMSNAIEHMEDVLRGERPGGRARTREQAIAFLDLSGFTRLTEEEGDEAAADLAARLADMVQDESRTHGGRPVKLLGDGVMFHFPEPGRAVGCALDLVERAPHEGLPPARVGVSTGPVVFRDGDYFGRTVNVAARVADRAQANQVLVTDEVVQASPGAAAFREMGAFDLKGLSRPITLHLAERPA